MLCRIVDFGAICGMFSVTYLSVAPGKPALWGRCKGPRVAAGGKKGSVADSVTAGCRSIR